MAGRVVLRSRLGEIARGAEKKTAVVVAKTAADVETGCKERSRVDTGQMRDGWETVSHGPLAAEVINAVGHVVFNEYGTEDMEAQPMAVPAAEAARAGYYAAMAAIYR